MLTPLDRLSFRAIEFHSSCRLEGESKRLDVLRYEGNIRVPVPDGKSSPTETYDTECWAWESPAPTRSLKKSEDLESWFALRE